jgi:6-phosphogluconolactonase
MGFNIGTFSRSVFLAVVSIGITAGALEAQGNGPFGGQSGFVYTETNGANNAVLVFNRAANGALSLAATVPTGGLGGGVVSVGSQGALALSPDGQWLFAVNEGGSPDGSVSVMRRTPTGLQAAGVYDSGGNLPVSITVSRNLVYVLNDSVTGGTPANITGFYFDAFHGTLSPIPNSTRSLSAPHPTTPAAGPVAAEIHFDNTGLFLYVAEVGTSLIDTYSVNFFDGTPSQDRTQTSFGLSPFAFAFDPRDNLLVTEVDEPKFAGAATSYQLSFDGNLNPISGSVQDGYVAPCWIAISPDGRFAYTVNTASQVISGYQVGFNGQLSLLGNGNAASTPPHPLDNAFTPDGRFMYVVTAAQMIGYQVNADGSLTSLNLNPTATALTSSTRGLVVL